MKIFHKRDIRMEDIDVYDDVSTMAKELSVS